MRKSWAPIALFAGAVLAIAGCQENLTGGAACPSLCPDTLTVRDTVLVGRQVLDTDATLLGVPPLGTEQRVLLADYQQGGQPVRAVGVFRFDSLQRVFPDSDTTKAPRYFNRIDSAAVYLTVVNPDTGADTAFVHDSVTFLVYDVDTSASDFDTSAVIQRFSSTPIASRVLPPDSIKGTVKIPLDSAFASQHVLGGTRIRLGIRVQSPKNVQVRVGSSEAGSGAQLRYFAYADTSKLAAIVNVNTRSTASPTIASLSDYTLVLQGTPPPPDGILAAGGVPGSRIFLRFAIPAALLDSSTTVVRANLELHQVANTAFQSTDTLSLLTRVVRAAPAVTDIVKASLLAVDPSVLGVKIPTVRATPGVARIDTIPLVGLLTQWRMEGTGKVQRAVILQASGESLDPRQYYFYSSSASVDSLRPRLRISYIPRSGFGLP